MVSRLCGADICFIVMAAVRSSRFVAAARHAQRPETILGEKDKRRLGGRKRHAEVAATAEPRVYVNGSKRPALLEGVVIHSPEQRHRKVYDVEEGHERGRQREVRETEVLCIKVAGGREGARQQTGRGKGA